MKGSHSEHFKNRSPACLVSNDRADRGERVRYRSTQHRLCTGTGACRKNDRSCILARETSTEARAAESRSADATSARQPATPRTYGSTLTSSSISGKTTRPPIVAAILSGSKNQVTVPVALQRRASVRPASLLDHTSSRGNHECTDALDEFRSDAQQRIRIRRHLRGHVTTYQLQYGSSPR